MCACKAKGTALSRRVPGLPPCTDRLYRGVFLHERYVVKEAPMTDASAANEGRFTGIKDVGIAGPLEAMCLEESWYIISPYAGETLAQYAREVAPKLSGCDWLESLRVIAVDLCLSGVTLAQRNIVHGDMKPENCTFDGVMTWRIDFGSATYTHIPGSLGAFCSRSNRPPEHCCTAPGMALPTTEKVDVYQTTLTLFMVANLGEEPEGFGSEEHHMDAILSCDWDQELRLMVQGLVGRYPDSNAAMWQQFASFLRCGFSVDPQSRPSFEQLLEHPFIKGIVGRRSRELEQLQQDWTVDRQQLVDQLSQPPLVDDVAFSSDTGRQQLQKLGAIYSSSSVTEEQQQQKLGSVYSSSSSVTEEQQQQNLDAISSTSSVTEEQQQQQQKKLDAISSSSSVNEEQQQQQRLAAVYSSSSIIEDQQQQQKLDAISSSSSVTKEQQQQQKLDAISSSSINEEQKQQQKLDAISSSSSVIEEQKQQQKLGVIHSSSSSSHVSALVNVKLHPADEGAVDAPRTPFALCHPSRALACAAPTPGPHKNHQHQLGLLRMMENAWIGGY